jgi:hypothetical protein
MHHLELTRIAYELNLKRLKGVEKETLFSAGLDFQPARNIVVNAMPFFVEHWDVGSCPLMG